jgi:hypothetical protein
MIIGRTLGIKEAFELEELEEQTEVNCILRGGEEVV